MTEGWKVVDSEGNVVHEGKQDCPACEKVEKDKSGTSYCSCSATGTPTAYIENGPTDGCSIFTPKKMKIEYYED